MSDEPAPPPLTQRPELRAAALAGVVVVAVAVAVALQVSGEIPFDSDEANHATLGLRQYQDLAAGEPMDFVRHSYRTGQFPFLHGWMLLPSFAVFGATAWAARIAQVFLLVLGAGATGWAAYRVADDRPAAGALAAMLFALSPDLAAMSGLCMLEVPGAALTAVSLALFAEACRQTGRRAYVLHALTAGAVLATYYTKLNYGIWIAPAVGAGHVARTLDPRTRREALRHLVLYVVLILVLLGVWYSTESARSSFWGFLTNPSQAVSIERDDPTFSVPGLSPDNLFAYFLLIPRHFHVEPLLGGAVLLAFGAGLWRRDLLRRPALVASAATVAWTWLVLSMEFREYALARFIATALPPLWIVSAGVLIRAWERVPWPHVRQVAAALVVGGGLLVQLMFLPDRLRDEYEVGAEFRPVFGFLVESIPAPASVAVVSYTDHTSARTLVWELATRPGGSYRDHDVKAFIAERIYESPRKLDAWFDDPRPWGAEDWSGCVVHFEPGPRYPDTVVGDTLELWREALAARSERLELIAERYFEDVDVHVRVYRDRSSPPHLGLTGGR